MDIQQLDITSLKALAYEQIVELQRIQTNINLIQDRIIELEKEQNGIEKTEDK